MSDTGETFSYKLVVDASQADAQLAKTDASARKLGGGLSLITGGLGKLDGAEREASKALRGISGSMGGLSTATIGAIGPIGDIAGLLASGGVFGIALAACGLAVAALTKHWENLNEAQSKAIDLQYSSIDATTAQTHKLYDELAKLKGELAGPETSAQMQANTATKVAEIDAKIKDLRKALGGVSAEDQAQKSMREAELLQLQKQRQLLLDIQTLKMAVRGRDAAEKVKTPKGEKPNDWKNDLVEAGMKQLDANDAARESYLENLAKARKALDEKTDEETDNRMKAQLKAQEEADKQRIEQARKTEEEIASIKQTYADLAQSSAQLLADTSMQYLEDKIEGTKYAEEIAAQYFLKSIGSQLIGIGIKQAFEGAGLSIVGSPNGPPLAALGAAAIVAGVSMGGVATVMGVDIGKKQAADDKREKARSGASRERGTGSRSRGSSSGDGGGVTVNISYGIGGPRPEQTAEAVARAARLAQRRRFA